MSAVVVDEVASDDLSACGPPWAGRVPAHLERAQHGREQPTDRAAIVAIQGSDICAYKPHRAATDHGRGRRRRHATYDRPENQSRDKEPTNVVDGRVPQDRSAPGQDYDRCRGQRHGWPDGRKLRAMLGEHKHLQHTLRDHGGVTATAMVEQAHCLGSETSSGLHETSRGWWFALKVAVKADGVEPFDASLRAFVHNYLIEGETIPVIFDPADHGKICMDTESVERERESGGEAARALLQNRIDAFKAAGAATPQTVLRGSEQADAFAMAEPEPGNEVEHLEQLAKLHEAGALTDAEFAAAKAKLLGDAS